MTQGTTTRGIEIGQGFVNALENQSPIEIVTTNIEIPIGYLVNPTVGLEVESHDANMVPPTTE